MIDLVVDTGLGDVPARLARTDADLAAMATWMRDRRDVVLGLDTETNAINPWDRDYRLRLIQISDGREAWLAEPSGAVRDMLRAHPTFVAHYSEAEIRFLGCGLPGAVRMEDSEPHIIDTQPILAFYDPRTLLPRKDGIDIRLIHPKGLKDTFTREFSPGLKQAEDALHAWFTKHAPVGRRTKKAAAVWGFANVPVEQPEYLTYGAFDAIAVKWLYDKMVAAPVVVRQLSHVVRAVARQWDIDRMTYRGLPVDPDYVRWLDKELIELIDINAQQLSGYGVPSSAMGDSIAAAFTNLGVSAVSKTKTGRPQWDKAALLVLLDTGVTGRAAELTSLILKSRQATKFRAAYVAPMLDALGRDGRVHCSFRTVGTVTHRDSAANPALQQLPKKDPRIRAAIGGVDGWVIVSADFAQGEPRVMAAHSGDPNYLAALNSGDINSAIAAESFGDAFHPADGKKAGTPSYLMRNAAKAGFLAYCYAVGDAKGARTVGVSVDQWRTMRTRWTQTYRVLFERGQQLNRGEYVTLPSGRTVTLWDRKHVADDGRVLDRGKPSRKGLNYETQAAQKDLLEAAWFRLRETWQHYLAFFLHDEIVLHVPVWLAERAQADLKAAMTMELGNGVTMECEATIDGRTWLPQNVTRNDLVSSVDTDDEDM